MIWPGAGFTNVATPAKGSPFSVPDTGVMGGKKTVT